MKKYIIKETKTGREWKQQSINMDRSIVKSLKDDATYELIVEVDSFAKWLSVKLNMFFKRKFDVVRE